MNHRLLDDELDLAGGSGLDIPLRSRFSGT
jgi:hypothetical protein